MNAPAKVNLWLRVFPPDATGLHPLDTLFCALDLADDITIEQSHNGIELTVTGHDVGPSEKNLAYRAALDFYHTTGLQPSLRITLQKNIPAGAGLGGGSSDAATVLRILNEMHGNVLPDTDLLAMAARLGSDVAFFLCGSPLAHARGRGEILRAMPALPAMPALVVKPPLSIATPAAYAWLDEERCWSEDESGEVSAPQDWDDVANKATNDFERVVFKRHPELERMRDSLREMGARIALLSGSGSALFGIFDTTEVRDRAAQRTPGSVATTTRI
ncbi:MAG TPA: 4-(cytidine 5'-diphospho)-2-C-methyl-D-erythritol kinase [Longimicrobiales bacterium]|nr:4-(cytidine 5'-diphospho)-2-C-methyl-D-erythritol kinase [Longimicrobiales bacterium]